jgi:hypothetical protein
MHRLAEFLSKKLPPHRPKERTARLRLEMLEERECPTAVVFAAFVPFTAILNLTEVFGANSPSNGPGANLLICGNTPPGGGATSMVTVLGGFGTTVNGMNGATFTTAFPGSITSINVTFLNDNASLVVGTPTGILNLPGTTLNVTVGSGNDTFTMGTAGGAGNVPAVNNVLNGLNWKAANINSTGSQTVDILDATVASINIQENSGPGDRIRLWGVTANGQVSLSQNNGSSDTISIDQLVTGVPPVFGGVGKGTFQAAGTPFPAIGLDTQPALILTIGPGGVPTATYTGQPAYEGHDDNYIGVVNLPNSGVIVSSLALSGASVFDFDGDGIGVSPNPTSGLPGAPGGPFGPTGYEGPGTNFTVTNVNSGLVNFLDATGSGLLPGQETFFSLEDPAIPGALTTTLATSTVASVMGVVKTTQGNGRVDNTTINRTQVRVSLSATQGNGSSDGLFLGTGDTAGSKVTSPGAPPSTSWNGPLLLSQGSGADDYIGVDNLSAGAVSVIQQDLAGNTTGDQVGGVRTNAIPPATNFGTAGLNAPSTVTTGLPNEAGGVNEVVRTAHLPFDNSLGVTAPVDGFRNALLEQLNITQGSAAGDLVALLQLPAPGPQATGIAGNATICETLCVPGSPFIPGVPSTPGTVTILQGDLAGNRSDFVFMGSYTPNPSFTPAPPGSPGFGSPPYAWTAPLATGSITALNYLVTQGNATGDVMSVLFTTATSPTTALSSLFLQGNGGDDAFFQRDTAATGGLFNFFDGSGGNYVQADSLSAIGTFDGGSNVAANILGQDNNNLALLFVDFGNVIFA